MTNAEKLARDTERLARILDTCMGRSCNGCPIADLACDRYEEIVKWLESEAHE